MSMKSATSPRRIYLRAGRPLACFGGLYFGPASNKTSAINTEKTVRIEVLKRDHSKARIAVTQGDVTETWSEQKVVFASR